MPTIQPQIPLPSRASARFLALLGLIGLSAGCGDSANSIVGGTAPVVALAVTPDPASVGSGGTASFSVLATRQDNTTFAPAVAWSATGGTIDSNGAYTAGTAPGVFEVTATLEDGPLTDTATITVTAGAPVLQGVVLSPASATLAAGESQQFTVTGQWSDGGTTPPAVTYAATGGTITPAGLYTAGGAAGSFRLIATQQGGSVADSAAITITAGSPAGTTLLSEGFEDGSLGSRGWFDATTVSVITDNRPGSTGTKALQWHWTSGATAPQGASRVDFTPSGSVYLSYWVKTSSNWIGSSRSYHPHMFHFLTTADDHWTGPSRSHLTLYDELLHVSGGLTPVLSMQDALMIDGTKLLVDLTNLTEQRSIGGYNGRPEPNLTWDAFQTGPGTYTNYKLFQPGTIVITDANKNSWHHVESYWQLNTIQNGKGQPDGIVQYWVDGNLVIDRHDIYFRTAVNASMLLRTFIMAPYIGDGSPRDQYMWIDDVTIRTVRP